MRLLVVALVAVFVMLPLLSSPPSRVAAQTDGAESSADAEYNSSAGPAFTLPQWTDGAGWTAAEYYSTIQMADVDGDGSDELLARGPNGMVVYSWDTTLGLWSSLSDSGPFDDDAGWTKAEYYTTIQSADIDGDGAAELIGRASNGISTYEWSGSGWTQLATGAPDFGDSGGWNQEHYYSTIQLADIDGDGAAEMLARSSTGIETYRWSSGAWTKLDKKNPPWSDKEGWEKHRFYSTIQTGDIDGDGAAELLARGVNGMDTYDWNGSSWSLLESKSPKFSDKDGWNKERYYSTIQTADVNGDGKEELLGRAAKGMTLYSWDGSEWSHLKSDSPSWSDSAGWDKARYYATIQAADVNGDGKAELFARSTTGIDLYSWSGSDWTSLESAQPELKDSHWKDAENYLTIQTGDIDGDGDADLVARGLYGIRTWTFDASSSTGWQRPTTYGFVAFTADQETAYEFINSFLKIESGQDLRGQYSTDSNTLSGYQSCLLNGTDNNNWADWTELPTETCETLGGQTAIAPPSGLTLADWNTVARQLVGELGLAQSVSDYYADLLTLFGSIYADGKDELDSVSQTLYGENLKEKKVDALYESLFMLPLKLGPVFGPGGSAISGALSAGITLGISAASSDSFQGDWSAALTQYAEMVEDNKDGINNSHAYVVGDAGLMTYVANQKTSGAWDPADAWVTRYLTSEGRRGTAGWIYQTLSPALWEIDVFWYLNNSSCGSPGNAEYQYYTNKNKDGDCFRQVANKSSGFPSSKLLKNIMGKISGSCSPTPDNDATWEYGKCDVGVARKDFFLNEDGWNFDVNSSCFGCPSAAPDLDVALGDPENTIDLSDPGHTHVLLYGQEDFDAASTLPSSLIFAGASPLGWWAEGDTWHGARSQDFNGDGYIDVLAAFPVQDMTELDASSTEATLTGTTSDGSTFRFTASVTIIASS